MIEKDNKISCEIDGCHRHVYSKDLCQTHFNRVKSGNFKVEIQGDVCYSKVRGYNSWVGMKQRCYNKNNKRYHDYGGRGITICKRWRYSFQNFLKDMGVRPKGTSIERINNDGIYEPKNCKWAEITEQSLNKRRYANNTSGVKGISKKQGGFMAYLTIKGNDVLREFFKTRDEAVYARLSAENKYLGKSHDLNHLQVTKGVSEYDFFHFSKLINLGIMEISRRTGISRLTVKKYMNENIKTKRKSEFMELILNSCRAEIYNTKSTINKL